MTGNKEVLLEKLGKLTEEQYRKYLPAMDRYFPENRFIRVHQTPLRAESFPVLKDVEYIRNLLLSVYLLKHLRGNAIVEADFQNDTYTAEDATDALITGKVAVVGAFVKAG